MSDTRDSRPADAESAISDQIDIGTLRNLIRDAFTADELVQFCRDHRHFAPIIAYFGPGFSFEKMIDVVLEYCQTRVLLSELLAAVRQFNPGQYVRYYSSSRTSTPRPIDESGIQQHPVSPHTEPQHREKGHVRTLLYLLIVIPVVFGLCAAFSAWVDSLSAQKQPSTFPVEISSHPLLIAVGVVLAAISALLIGLVANWLSEKLKILPRSRKSTAIVVIVTLLLFVVFASIFIAILQS